MNPFTVETKFCRNNNNSNNNDITSNSISGAGPGVGIIRSEIKENNVILYRISREAIHSLSTNPSVDNDGLEPGLKTELKQDGIVFLINEELNTVQIKQAENIFDSLVASTTGNEAPDTMLENVPDTPETAACDEAADTVVEENVTEEDMLWNTAIVVLCGSSLNSRLHFLPSLYEKAVERIVKAGRYELIPSSSASASSESSVSSVSSETDDTEVAEKTDEAAGTANSAGSSVDTEETADKVAATKVGTECDFIIFLIGYLLRCDVFMPSNNPNNNRNSTSDHNTGNNGADLTGTTLYLTNKNKNVSAIGVLTQCAKRILVKAGSTISSDNRLPTQKGQASSASLRQKLIEDGVIVEDRFVEDWNFASTSAAASVILGQSASGMNTWRDEAGRKLETLLGR